MSNFNSERIVLSVADVGHHGELLSKLIFSWFNHTDDIITIDEYNNIEFEKISISTFGKSFVNGLFFGTGQFNSIAAAAVKERKKFIKNIPEHLMSEEIKHASNAVWPVITTLHYNENTLNMKSQLNSANNEFVMLVSPYGNMDESSYFYLNRRHKWFGKFYDSDRHETKSIEATISRISDYDEIVSITKFSLIRDIVSGTYDTLEEMKSCFGIEPKTRIELMREWLDVANKAYKIKFVGKQK